MCGIVGYTGSENSTDLLVAGLGRLEYRGYDSSGLAVQDLDGRIAVRKKAGRIEKLARHLKDQPLSGSTGIGHTRWATHGAPSDANSHPHLSFDGTVAVVHNGVIENHLALRRQLQEEGIRFNSDTDTEVIAHLIARQTGAASLEEAVGLVLPLLKGTYGIAVVSSRFPGVIVGARLGSPLIVGIAQDGYHLASDKTALAGRATQAVFLEDRQLCVLQRTGWKCLNQEMVVVDPSVEDLGSEVEENLLSNFEHHMLKEIHEQPESLENALRGRLDDGNATAHFGGLNLTARQLRRIDRIILTGCGTSYYAALVGEHLLEEFARIPVEVEYASEFRYRNPPMDRNTLVFAVTQSGETADTLAALRESKRRGHPTLAICNVVGSSIAREADGGIYLHAGPEIGVASTKAFTSQVTVFTLLALYLGRMRNLSSQQGQRMIDELRSLPGWVRQALDCQEQVANIATRYCHFSNFLYLGRQYLHPLAMEGALKLKEISYIHAEGYPAAEMKHGPIALVDKETPSVFLLTRGQVFDKVMSNVSEIRARGGPVIGIGTAGDEEVRSCVDELITIPDVPEYLQPIVAAIPLQLLAYHIAVLRGCDVDKPRNLAKSVTVE